MKAWILTTVAVAVLALGAATSMVVPAESVPNPVSADVTVPPLELPVSCPGPMEAPLGDVDPGEGEFDGTPRDRVLWLDAAVDPRPVADGSGRFVDARVATLVERVGGGDIAGLAGVTCTSPSADLWLVGGSTALGSSARLVMTNPSSASVEATVTLYGPVGQVEQQTTVVIAPLSERAVLLESVAAGLSAVVARVESTGAGVSATIQDSRLDGFQPAGSDWVASVAAPSTRLVIPAVGVGGRPEEAVSARVRLMAPEGATVTLTLVTPAGIVAWGGTSGLEIDPGVVVEVPVPPGHIGSIEISADAAVVAGALTTQSRPVEGEDQLAGSLAFDHGWVSGRDHRDGDARTAVVPQQATHVRVYAPVSGIFELTDTNGDVVISQVMEPRTSTAIPVDIAAGTVVSADGPFTWALQVSDTTGFITFVQPEVRDVEDVTITVRPAPFVYVP